MSLPKIGSVTVEVGENGTRWIQSRTVSHAPDTEPPMINAISSARATSPHPASGVRSGRSPAAKVIAGALALPKRSRPVRNAEPPGDPRSSAAWAASLIRSNSVRSDPGRSVGGGVSRPASHRLPRSATAATTKAAAPSPNIARTRVQKTES